jgi:hypothetical protein
MADTAVRAPLVGAQPDSATIPSNEVLIPGYGPLAAHLTAAGYRISRSTLQKNGAPSAGGGDLPIEGYWGGLPMFRPSQALAWARNRMTPSRSAPNIIAPPMQPSAIPVAPAPPARRGRGRPRKLPNMTTSPPTAPVEQLPSTDIEVR